MDITCKIINILPVESFTSSKNGQTYNRYGFIGETQEQYPKKIHFQCLGDERWQKLGIVLGEEFQISYDLSSREWKGRWFTQVDVWRAERKTTGANVQAPVAPAPAPTQNAPVSTSPAITTNDVDVPF
jgi:hypothetical protein